MRAASGGRHVSGQERIVTEDLLEETILELHRRPKGEWDFQSIKVEKLSSPPEVVERSLPLKDHRFSCVPLAHSFVSALFEEKLGIDRSLVRRWLAKLTSGVGPGGQNLPGALLVDPQTGEVLNGGNPVRTILFDWLDRPRVKRLLLQRGFTERTLDALALATKNALCGVEAELCVSDDPDYTTGYAASPELGYLRVAPMKEKKSPFGGRVYFVRKENARRVVECLRKRAVLIGEPNL